MTGDDRQVLRDRLRAALTGAVGLPAADMDSIGVLIEAGDLLVALETLCTQIYEYDLEVDASQRSRLEELGSALGVAAAYLLGDPWAAAPKEDDE